MKTIPSIYMLSCTVNCDISNLNHLIYQFNLNKLLKKIFSVFKVTEQTQVLQTHGQTERWAGRWTDKDYSYKV